MGTLRCRVKWGQCSTTQCWLHHTRCSLYSYMYCELVTANSCMKHCALNTVVPSLLWNLRVQVDMHRTELRAVHGVRQKTVMLGNAYWTESLHVEWCLVLHIGTWRLDYGPLVAFIFPWRCDWWRWYSEHSGYWFEFASNRHINSTRLI